MKIRIKILLVAGATVFAAPIQAQPAVPIEATMSVPRVPGQNPDGMHIYIRAGLKTHMIGQHDYPQFLADWSKLLTAKGAVVDGSLHAPSVEELAKTDVLILDRGDTGFMTPVERAALDGFVKRGGGIVVLHDAECGPDPVDMASLVGGAKKHGEKNYTLEASVPYTIVDRANPIMLGMTDLALTDEAFFKMTWAKAPAPHILATAVVADTPSAAGHAGEVAPQIWTYEHTLPGGRPARAFVWMQGHIYANYANPQIQTMLLRGIAWAAGKPVDELVAYEPVPRPAG